MPPAGFEPGIPASGHPQTLALDYVTSYRDRKCLPTELKRLAALRNVMSEFSSFNVHATVNDSTEISVGD